MRGDALNLVEMNGWSLLKCRRERPEKLGPRRKRERKQEERQFDSLPACLLASLGLLANAGTRDVQLTGWLDDTNKGRYMLALA